MSAVALTLEYQVGNASGEQQLERMAVAFERAGAELANFGRHIFPQLVPVLESGVKAQFDAEGAGPASGPWAQLSAAYAAWKAETYPGQPLLVATGALRDALTVEGSANALRDYSDSMFNFGTQGLEYASFHQTGTASMPPRPPFDFGPDFERQLQRAAAQGVRDAVREAGVDEFATVKGDE